MNRTIALICDDNYVMPTAVTIQSIKDSHYGDCILDVYVCSFQLSASNREFMHKLSSNSVNVMIKLCDVNNIQDRIEKIKQKTHVTQTSLLKFELPNLFKDIDSLLYLDSDIIVKGNIEDLFMVDISDYYLAAIPEMWKYLDKYWGKLEYSIKKDFYFNSGVLLYNLKKMREDDVTKKLWENKLEMANDFSKKTMDQDTLNEVCSSRTRVLPILWNFNTAFSNSKVVNVSIFNAILNTNFYSFEEIVNSAHILHYVGKEDKPWLYSTANCITFWDEAYNNAGFEFANLGRKAITHNISWYFDILREMLGRHGLLYTLRYINCKLKTSR